MASKKSNSYEGSAADKRADKAAAKQRGISQKAYEGSAADRRADAKATKRGSKRGY